MSSQTTERLLARMAAAAAAANAKVLLNPMQSPAIVQSTDLVASAIGDFHGRLGIESGRDSLEARAWVDAATDLRDKVLEKGAERVDASRRLGKRPSTGPRR
jgi:hypothetical protein